jgi:hypothetical protein
MQTVQARNKQATFVLRDTNAAPPLGPDGKPARPKGDVLLVRIAIDAALPAAYACPCGSGACDGAAGCLRDDQCAAGPCCIDSGCADGGFQFYYAEFSRFPVAGDYGGPDLSGVAIRAGGALRDCESTRLVPTHTVNGAAQYALTQPDPAGKLPGSWFEDTVRRVIVRLDGMGTDWAQISVLRY